MVFIGGRAAGNVPRERAQPMLISRFCVVLAILDRNARLRATSTPCTPDLNVDRIADGALRVIHADIQPEPARDQVAEAGAAADRRRRVAEAVASPCLAGADEADD